MTTKSAVITTSSGRQFMINQRVTVRFGSRGTQLAKIAGPSRVHGCIRVRKYRANSDRWTRPVRIHCDEIL